MKVVTPDYYSIFKCTAAKCPDNCCIGWEIDVDEDTYNKYLKIDGDFGNRLRSNITISEDGSRCFRLTPGERCPFLNENNLCDIILNAGEENLCSICENHPRFHNCFGNIRETGIGISCIEAAIILLTKQDKTSFVSEITDEPPYEIDYDENFLNFLLKVRNNIINILQDRSKSVKQRFLSTLIYAEFAQTMADSGNFSDPNAAGFDFDEICEERTDIKEFIEILKALIPLNDEWNMKVNNIDIHTDIAKVAEENPVMLEQLSVYYIYRHFLSAVYDGDIIARVKFAVFCCLATILISANSNSFAEAACLVSKEIEYCSENIDAILDSSYTYDAMKTERLISVL